MTVVVETKLQTSVNASECSEINHGCISQFLIEENLERRMDMEELTEGKCIFQWTCNASLNVQFKCA